MKKYYIVATLLFYSLSFSINNRKFIEDLYQNISGFSIPPEEDKTIKNAGGEPTYGEITCDGTEELIKKFNLSKKDCFYDLGCGTGKMVIQVYLETPIKKSCGIELSHSRINQAQEIKKQLKKDKKIKRNRRLDFKETDLLEAKINDATAIYIASLCFSDDLMQKITNKLSKLKKGLKIASLRKLSNENAFTFKESTIIPMTWSNHTPVYIYELTNPQ